jgi:DNA-binding response OmpR family regulator
MLMAGYQSHVVKPVELAELVTVIASLAGRTERDESAQHARAKCGG